MSIHQKLPSHTVKPERKIYHRWKDTGKNMKCRSFCCGKAVDFIYISKIYIAHDLRYRQAVAGTEALLVVLGTVCCVLRW